MMRYFYFAMVVVILIGIAVEAYLDKRSRRRNGS